MKWTLSNGGTMSRLLRDSLHVVRELQYVPCRGLGSLVTQTGGKDSFTSKVSQIVDSGAAQFFTISPQKTVFEAVQQMVNHNCGSLIVKAENRVVGIITERDYLTKIITKDRASKSTVVKDIMTKDIISVDATSTVGESMRIMASHNIRHLPVLQNNELVGVVTMRELVRKVAETHERQVSYLMAQIERMAIVIGEGSKSAGSASS
eukprot:Plantae.Rhodophyta-Purpureofilum_apyrenoidigerum.ctg7822.p1 GENE.Plantae.Rhodophyta-Purpureofilum_apyrenoidigerum.ctg7822~~Plantae.Rhodophyta-Purpureofilum_apyrenoidigerum.ctg7822.p1  ORF type:complete len:206 (+),score=33.46 Plantae.Rhodophyta-Purpureofilum_apyrenoidigerum.ctg7822:252-869(+)